MQMVRQVHPYPYRTPTIPAQASTDAYREQAVEIRQAVNSP